MLRKMLKLLCYNVKSSVAKNKNSACHYRLCFHFYIFSDDSPSQFNYATYHTKSTPVLHLHFTRKNLLLATGPYVNP